MGVREDLERAMSPDELDEIITDVARFLAEHPDPEDRDFHAWAEGGGLDVHEAEAAAYVLATRYANLLLVDGKSVKGGFSEEDADLEELKAGVEVEKEHTDDPMLAKKIALDHLAELPDYYTRLRRMERSGLRG